MKLTKREKRILLHDAKRIAKCLSILQKKILGIRKLRKGTKSMVLEFSDLLQQEIDGLLDDAGVLNNNNEKKGVMQWLRERLKG